MKQIGHNSKIGCVLNVDMKPEVPWDRSVYGHSLINHGSIWNLNGRYFDGSDDYIDCGNKPEFQFTSEDFTIEFQIYMNNISTSQVPIGKGSPRAFTPYFFWITPAGDLRFYTCDSSTDDWLYNTWSIPLPKTWYYVTDIKNKTNQKLYINGLKKDSDNSWETVRNTNTPLTIGWGVNEISKYHFNGLINNNYIYSHALYTSKIKSHYLT